MKRIRLAVIGAGHLGRIHARLAAANPQFDLVAVVDPSPEARRTVASELECTTVTDYRELYGAVDAAIVATPTRTHYEVTSSLLRAGVHCLVEKPLAHRADQAHRLVQIARNRHRVLQVGHVERFNPMWSAAQGRLEAPQYVEATRCGPFSGRSTDIGVVFDLMVHDLDLILSVEQSPIVGISASGLALLGKHEDLAEARLEFASGMVAVLRASRVATAATRRMQWYCHQGFVDIDFSGNTVRVVRPSAAICNGELDVDQLPVDQRMQLKSTLFEHYLHREAIAVERRNAIVDEQHDFAVSIAAGSQPIVTGDAGARAVEVAEQIVEAIASRNWQSHWRRQMAPGSRSATTKVGPASPTTFPTRRAG
ncbi:MAG: NADH-dependent dehydrogenase [Pirellulaceae bacterium]|nr:MAG: NADH-dependent dehydrogenase [Pirellulaceae bacterium]